MGDGGVKTFASSFHGLRRSFRRAEIRLNNFVAGSCIGRYFKLESRDSTFTRELRAGLAVFLTMAYILSVNSSLLSLSGGPCASHFRGDCLAEIQHDFVVATAMTAAIGTAAMGVLANLPFALAPAMGTNAYFTYAMVGIHGSGKLPYGAALAAVMLEGCLFFLLSALGLRSKIARLVPESIRCASAAGIGLFLAFVGLQSHQGVGLIGPSDSTLVTLTACSNADPVTGACTHGDGVLRSPTFWLGAAGFLIGSFGLSRNFKGSIICAILLVTAFSWPRDTAFTFFPHTPDGNARFDYFKYVVDFNAMIKRTFAKQDFSYMNKSEFWVAFATLLHVDVLATTSSIYSMAALGGFMDDKGKFDGEYSAFIVDAATTVVSTVLGTTTATTYIESTAGLQEGGRTGITAIVVALCFLASVVFGPVMVSVPPWAVGPALVLVGVMMVKMLKKIDWDDLKEAVPAFITMLLMPLTFSIANGFIAGLIAYIVLNAYDYVAATVNWVVEARRVMAEARNQVFAATGAADGIFSGEGGATPV